MQVNQTSQPHARHENAQTAATDAPQPCLGDIAREAVSSRLFLMTTLGAATGQIPMLAAEGLLASPAVVVTVALTVVAGVGAFLAAVDETRLENARGRRVFAATALLSIAANVGAAGVGLTFAQLVSIEHVRYFAALALAAVAVEIASQRELTVARGVPVPGALVVVGVLAEVLV